MLETWYIWIHVYIPLVVTCVERVPAQKVTLSAITFVEGECIAFKQEYSDDKHVCQFKISVIIFTCVWIYDYLNASKLKSSKMYFRLRAFSKIIPIYRVVCMHFSEDLSGCGCLQAKYFYYKLLTELFVCFVSELQFFYISSIVFQLIGNHVYRASVLFSPNLMCIKWQELVGRN